MSNFWTCSLDEQAVRREIARRESALKCLFERADQQESHLKAVNIDALEMTAWLKKYKAWRWHRQTRVRIQEVSPTYGISYILS